MSYIRYLFSWLLVTSLCVIPTSVWAQTAEDAEMGYGWLLFRMVVILAIVCILAYVILRWGVRRFVAPDRQVGPMQVVARLPVEPRRSVLLIRVGDRCMVVGSSEAGMTALGEIPASELDLGEEAPQTPFQEVLTRIRPGAPKPLDSGEDDDEIFHVKQEAS